VSYLWKKIIDFFYFNKEAQGAQESNAVQFKELLMLSLFYLRTTEDEQIFRGLS
jgi:hypothetical protein